MIVTSIAVLHLGLSRVACVASLHEIFYVRKTLSKTAHSGGRRFQPGLFVKLQLLRATLSFPEPRPRIRVRVLSWLPIEGLL